MIDPNTCPNCHKQYADNTSFCGNCGQARFPSTTVDQSQNQGGTNIVAGRDVTLRDEDRWDTRIRMHMDRSNQRRIWPADLVSAISGAIAILSFFGASQLPSAFLWPLIAVAFGSAVVLYFAYVAGNDLRSHGSHVLPFGFGVLERTQDGANWLTEPVAACPLCPADKQSFMRVQRSPRGPVWVCEHTSAHEIGFDGAQLPLLSPDA